ncbi:ferredoxin reductase [Streptococcus sp. IsoGale021]|uniref:ferredoxin reductase n=1 Tax=Streptococcus TaxID=1301 RepID=UPI0020014D6A|nr:MULTISPECIES: ferredoxin reductase [Streptococcus]MCY7209771.1 ferredoxin reductase [Streptococcus anginosus]MCY7211476.1 ferredoxin reductase [Streptococcus anginosus]MDQ8693837.1 ferredoxin reductase [Streptococcus sp. IsoGale021]MDU5128919.1 ferredoxin reductase [Streptococcus anginosus]MEE0847097.1 ferredoxin reductase [Streptococcus anginosus]
MKGRSKMLTIIVSILAVGLFVCLIIWGTIVYFGGSQSLSVKRIENPSDDIHLIHLTKLKNMTWKAGSYAKIALPNVKESGQKNRWLTIASNPDENEILILTHNSGSLYKKTLTSLSAGSKVEMSWLYSNLSVKDGEEPLVCFASDVGIAATRPIIKKWAGKRSIVLSHLDKGVLVFDKELSQIAQKYSNLDYSKSANLSQSKKRLKHAAEQYGNKAIYLLAGHPGDTEAMKKFLEDKGIDSKQIKLDSFRGLK